MHGYEYTKRCMGVLAFLGHSISLTILEAIGYRAVLDMLLVSSRQSSNNLVFMAILSRTNALTIPPPPVKGDNLRVRDRMGVRPSITGIASRIHAFGSKKRTLNAV